MAHRPDSGFQGISGAPERESFGMLPVRNLKGWERRLDTLKAQKQAKVDTMYRTGKSSIQDDINALDRKIEEAEGEVQRLRQLRAFVRGGEDDENDGDE